MLNESEVAFRKTDPWGPFRFAGINVTQKNIWNFGGQAINNDVALRFRSLSTVHRFEMDVKETFSWNTVDSRRLRGGPDMRYGSNFETNVDLSTDRAKRVVFKILYNGRHYLEEKTAYNTLQPSFIFRIGNHVKLTTQFNYANNIDELQYVNTVAASDGNEESAEYVLGRMKQRTYGITMNMQVNLTPDISIQYYGSPFTSTAKYDRFKTALDTRSHNYAERFSGIADQEITAGDGNYAVLKDGKSFGFKDPNFSFNEFRSNLVARWEYKPGSTVYLVWEHNRSRQDPRYYPTWGNNIDRMFGFQGVNTLMLKMNYWFAL